MIKYFLLIISSFGFLFSEAQDLEWDGNKKLQLTDFRSPATQIGSGNLYSLNSATLIDFSFYMSNAEFMFTKNFNSKVNTIFKPEASYLVSPDSASAYDLLDFANYEFDLTELYSRKFRKKMYEKKGAFSDVNFFRGIYDELQNEYLQRHSLAAKNTDIGRNKFTLNQLHTEVLDEIELLKDFCKSCKPPKKK